MTKETTVKRLREVKEQIKSCNYWNEPVPKSLLEERRRLVLKYGLPRIYKREVVERRTCWVKCIQSTSKDRFIPFISRAFSVAEVWKRRGVVKRRLSAAGKKYKVAVDDDILSAVFKLAIDRKKIERRTRHRWVCVLRYLAAFEIPPAKVEQAIVAVGGINECARRWQKMRRFRPHRH